MPIVILMLLPTEEARLQFEQFYRRCEPLLFKAAGSVLARTEDQEDAVQEACCYLADRYEDLFGPGVEPSTSYLYTLAKNKALDQLRKQSRTDLVGHQNPAEDISVPMDPPENHALSEAFTTLPDSAREALTLFYYDRLSLREIAKLCSISEAAAKKRVQRARDLLRDQLLAEGGVRP